MMIPIPFLGWATEDEDKEDLVAMLRKQIEIQQMEIGRLQANIHDLESRLYGGSVL